jgi:MSHA biogenesis protein MshP
MSPKNTGSKRQKGSSILIALFIMVVVMLLGTSLGNMIQSSSDTIASQVNGTRALSVANIGAERRLNELFPITFNLIASRCDDTLTYDNIGGGNVKGIMTCYVVVKCSDFKLFDVVYYHIESTGTCGINSRTIIVDAKSLR